MDWLSYLKNTAQTVQGNPAGLYDQVFGGQGPYNPAAGLAMATNPEAVGQHLASQGVLPPVDFGNYTMPGEAPAAAAPTAPLTGWDATVTPAAGGATPQGGAGNIMDALAGVKAPAAPPQPQLPQAGAPPQPGQYAPRQYDQGSPIAQLLLKLGGQAAAPKLFRLHQTLAGGR